ncbi:MAG: hypothetical protein JWQ35_584 [Bacteriovoracaceae bacterium]|nr:hypothetical protein [Bacteriovoracaceae bacterium]
MRIHSIFKFIFFVLILSFTTTDVSSVLAAELSLDDYLMQVRQNHEGFKASGLKAAGFKLEARERDLILSPNLTAEAKYLSDSKQTMDPLFQGDKTTAKFYSLGISQLTPFGLKGRLAYELMSTTLDGVDHNFVPLSNYYEGRPVLEITQSLWKNFFGSETRAQINSIEAKALASSFSESFKSKQLMAFAEESYWKTRLIQNEISVRKDTLERANQLKAWAHRRAGLELADKSDVLQAESALKGRKLELQLAEDNAKEIFRNFNSLRGQDSDQLVDALNTLSPEDFKALTIPERSAMRDDTKTAEQMSRLNEAAATLNKGKAQPTLEASASVALNGKDGGVSKTLQNSFKTNHPTYSVGIQLSAPLGWSSASDLREGAEKEKTAAELEYKRKFFEQEEEWKNLTQKFISAKDRLQLVRELEESEKEKVRHERERLQKGRTTTFQVLLFEQDYSASKLNRIQSEGEVLTLLAQLKTFK